MRSSAGSFTNGPYSLMDFTHVFTLEFLINLLRDFYSSVFTHGSLINYIRE